MISTAQIDKSDRFWIFFDIVGFKHTDIEVERPKFYVRLIEILDSVGVNWKIHGPIPGSQLDRHERIAIKACDIYKVAQPLLNSERDRILGREYMNISTVLFVDGACDKHEPFDMWEISGSTPSAGYTVDRVLQGDDIQANLDCVYGFDSTTILDLFYVFHAGFLDSDPEKAQILGSWLDEIMSKYMDKIRGKHLKILY